MGQYSNEITNRFETYGPPEGFCAICRLFRPLTRDHVPPKNCGNVRKSVIQHLFGDSVAHATRAKNVPTFSQTGSHFKTLCGECNNTRLGSLYDPVLGAVTKQVQDYFVRSSQSRLSLPRTQLFDYQPNKFARAIIGHLLAANAVHDVRTDGPSPPIDMALRAYFLDPSASFPDNLDLHYWLYPYRSRVIVKHGALGFTGSGGAVIYGHLLKFFPFAFWVVKNDAGFHNWKPAARRLNIDLSTDINAVNRLAIDLRPLESPNFPEAPEDNRMLLISDHLASRADDLE
ncbi:hypothetical protein [Caballeronia sp. SBC2]|uniref:hypothetical protein n=1 Tax=Caballeronia sp. SBC2 TaxID=2705547 RepID=UPI0013E2065F|nr:hypothetical protein [Caballeronia sp. SBC2]QIE22591.1 hypothetical protein SBC2_06010 [Caballeronia sp. SBC2]